MPDPGHNCDSACQKIIIDGRIMKARLRYAIEVLDNQEAAVENGLRLLLNGEQLAEILQRSKEQCDFSKVVEEDANKTANMIAYLLKELLEEKK